MIVLIDFNNQSKRWIRRARRASDPSKRVFAVYGISDLSDFLFSVIFNLRNL